MSTPVTVIKASSLTITASEIQSEHDAARRCASEAVAHAIKAGELLLQVKASLPHGEFGPWLAANVEFSDRTAQGYMRIANLDPEKRNGVADLSLRQALRTLSAPNQTPKVAPANLADETEDQRRVRVSAKLTRWMESDFDNAITFSPEDTSPQEARDWMDVLCPKAYFDIDPALCFPWDLEDYAEAFKTQRYHWLDTYLTLHAIAGVTPPSLGLLATEIETYAAIAIGRILGFIKKDRSWNVDEILQRNEVEADRLKQLARTAEVPQ